MTREEWQELCARLGLAPMEHVRDAGRVGVGAVGSHEVRVGLWVGPVPQPWAQLALEPWLDLGLGGGTVRRDEIVPAGHFTVSDPRLDRHLWLQADEPERARRLLVMSVRDGLYALTELRGAVLRLGDDGLLVEGQPGGEVPFFNAVVPVLSSLAASIDEAREHVPAPMALMTQQPPCRELARERGLQLRKTPLRIDGAVGPIQVTAVTSRSALRSHVFAVELALEEPLGLGLSIEPAGVLDAIRPSKIRFDDLAFNRVFRVEGRDPDRVRRVLVPEARAALLALLDKVTTFELGDAHFRLGGPVHVADQEGLAGLLRTACHALELVHQAWLRVTGRQAGPYR